MRTRAIVSTIVISSILIGIVVSRHSSHRDACAEACIDDIGVTAERILRGIRDVADVQVPLRTTRPTQRIIHIADAHYVNLDEFSESAYAGAARRGLRISDSAIARCHEAYTDDIAHLQDAQYRLLCLLVDHHHLRHVFHESLFEEDVREFQSEVDGYRSIGPKRDGVRQQIALITHEIEQGDRSGDQLKYLTLRRRWLDARLEILMNLGPIGNLTIARPFVHVLPAEDKEAYEDAGRELNVRPDGPASRAREVAMVRRLLAHKPCSVVILGRAHDLSREIEKQSGGRCEYIKVIVDGFPGKPLEPLFTHEQPEAAALSPVQ